VANSHPLSDPCLEVERLAHRIIGLALNSDRTAQDRELAYDLSSDLATAAQAARRRGEKAGFGAPVMEKRERAVVKRAAELTERAFDEDSLAAEAALRDFDSQGDTAPSMAVGTDPGGTDEEDPIARLGREPPRSARELREARIQLLRRQQRA
jgi:hypothetical protein